MIDDLTITEQQQLETQEAIIDRGLNTFVEVGNALMTIRDERLYRASFGTFEDYCRERWGMTRQHANRLVGAAEIMKTLEPTGSILPTAERQIRPLTQLPPAQQAAAWQQAIETAPNGKITAAHVESVVQEFNYKRDTKSTRPVDIYTPQGYDACQTPAYALDPLLPYLPIRGIVWEPAAGEGLLVDALYDAGFGEGYVIASDILTGGNFFEYEPDKWDCLVTNPPYSVKYQWLERCYQLGRPFALLVPGEMIFTQTAQLLFKKYGVGGRPEMILLNRRVNFKMPRAGWDGGGAQFPVTWLCWQLLPSPIEYGEIRSDKIN